MKMRQQDNERVADASELFAVGGDAGQHLGLHLGLARLAEIDVDEPELPAGHERAQRIDRLHNIAGLDPAIHADISLNKARNLR
jgi:hypothetical protein